MDDLIIKLQCDFPNIQFLEGETSCWSPQDNQIFYMANGDKKNQWTMLHEVGHALLKHKSYPSDIALLSKEVEAWQKAIHIAKKYNILIPPNYIQECLDTYRDWLYQRSTCPHCGTQGVQTTLNLYRCINCDSTWEVTAARFHRPYRRTRSLLY